MSASSLDTARTPDPERYWSDQDVDGVLDTLTAGGLVLVKGDIGYGLFGTSERAIRRMYEVKGRRFTNPCIFIGNLDVLDEVVELPSPEVRDWIADVTSWTTLAVVGRVRPGSRVLAGMDPWVRSQSVTDGTVAVFLGTGPYIEQLVIRAFAEGWVFVGSSANKSTTGNNFHFGELPPELIEAADYAVNHGRSKLENPGRLATTIVNFANWTIRREGVNAGEIKAEFTALRHRLVGEGSGGRSDAV